jgi:large conductance mechanosensitive channel
VPEKKSLVEEFRDFIASGDLILIAIAFIMAQLVKSVVDAFIAGVMNPIIAAIFGKQNFDDIGFDIGNARISIGLVITAVVNLVLTGLVLFAIYKWYQAFKRRQGVIIPPPAGPTDNELLREIRDLLAAQQRR